MRAIEFYEDCPICGSRFKSVIMEFTYGRCSIFNAICSNSKCGASFTFETDVKVLKTSVCNEDFIELSIDSKDAHCKWNEMCDRLLCAEEVRNNAEDHTA